MTSVPTLCDLASDVIVKENSMIEISKFNIPRELKIAVKKKKLNRFYQDLTVTVKWNMNQHKYVRHPANRRR